MGVSMFELFKKYAVPANSLKDFCERFHRHGSFHDRGDEYVAADMESHENDLKKYGYTIIPPGTSVTGDIVAYYGEQNDAIIAARKRNDGGAK